LKKFLPPPPPFFDFFEKAKETPPCLPQKAEPVPSPGLLEA
jgi:hypothetical protein